MRHVSRTHRVALDWLFDKINLDPKIQMRYIDTKQQLADILTKGNFTRDEWNNLLHLFNISHFSSTCCAKNSRLTSCPKKMAKRVQEQKDEERIVAKSRPTAMNLSSTVLASSSSAENLITSSDPGKLIAAGKPASRTRRNSRPDEAPSSQVKLKDVNLGGLMDNCAGKPVATEENQVLWKFSESESWSVIQSTSKAESFLCQCSTTLFFEKKKIKRNVKVMLTKLRIMLADFVAVIGHSWDLDQKRSGTELTLTNLMVFGIQLLTWCLNSQKAFIQCSVLPVPLKEANYEAKEGAWRLSISTVVNKTSNWSAQYPPSSSRFLHGGIQRYHGFRETRSTWSTRSFGDDGNSYRTSYCRLSDRWIATEKPVARIRRLVLRGDIVKDYSGSCAVFTKQGSSASQMTAAKIMDIISRLPGCAGQAADAVSAHTQVKLEDAPTLLKIPKSECPDMWIRLPRHKWPKSWSCVEDPVVPLERNLYGHPLAGLSWERQFEKVLLKARLGESSEWEC